MVIWASAATAAAVILIVILILYRRQVRKTGRQLEFLKARRTNLRLTSDLPLKEFNELIDGINEVLDQSREIRERSQLSHDIRTPLTSLDGYFQLLQQSDSEEERRKYVGIIQSRISSLKEMLEELFTYTRLQDADYELEMERIDFGKCAYDTVFSFYDEFQNRGIEPQVDFCGGHLFVRANEEAVRRALQNLIRNALVHGHTGISLELFEENGKAVFRCSNDVAHPEEIDIERVFSRFYKAIKNEAKKKQ